MNVRVISTELFGWEEWFESSRNLVDRISSHIWRISKTEVHKNFITKNTAAFWIFHIPPRTTPKQKSYSTTSPLLKNDEPSASTSFLPNQKKFKALLKAFLSCLLSGSGGPGKPQNSIPGCHCSKVRDAESFWISNLDVVFFSLIGNPWCPFYPGNRKYTGSQEGASFLAQTREPFFLRMFIIDHGNPRAPPYLKPYGRLH